MDYFFQEQRWTDTFLSLHVKKFKRIILFLLIAFSAAGAKAADVPTSWKDVTFNENIRYSQWVINSRISDFYANQTQRGFYTYDKNGTETGKSKGDLAFDYVPGLVAKAVLEAYANYSTFDWSKPWFYSVMNYAKEKTYTLVATSKATDFSKITLDNMNACKMYFPLMETGALSDGAKSTGETAIANVLTDMKKYNELYVIGNGSESGVKNSTNETVKSMFGGWFHKPSYKDQMWCDGLYMGAALLAQIVNYTKSTTNVDGTSDWNLITNQFTISWEQLYNTNSKGLLYHAFTANPGDDASKKWYGISNTTYHSAAFWGRAMGWYFLALVDVLEQMKLAGLDSESDDNHSYYTKLKGYLDNLALGLAKYQDEASGCWYQVVDEKDEHLTGNYLESSCTSLFAAAYLKAVRLGFLTSNGTYNYKTIGVNAFKGAVNQFMKYDTFEPTGTTVQLVHNCASAGLGGTNGRTGSREYYIKGTDVGQTNTYTEGKVMGAFIMAATEYELANPKAIRFSYDLAPTYTLAKGGSIKAEALGSGTISYQWFKSGDPDVSVATSETFSPTESGTYYCKATSGSTTIKTSKTVVTVNAVSNDVITTGEAIATFANLTSSAPESWTATENKGFTVTGIPSTKKYTELKVYAVKMNYKSTSQDATTITLNVPEGYTVTSLIITAINASASNTTEITLNGVDNVTIDKVNNAYKEYKVILTNPVTGSRTISITNSGGKELGISQIKVLGYQGTPSSLSITTQPVGATYDYGVSEEDVTALSVTAERTGIDEEITYRWYSNTTNSNTNGTPINGATSASYKPVVTTAGTTYYYCVVSAGGKSVTSDAVAVAVLNPSNLAINTESNYKKNSNAWTPAVGGTISITDIVTSSSMGAYSITTGDAATLNGTSLTAVKDGTITLKQAADDNYKEGSIEITVRIGQDVTSNGSNAYSFTEATNVSDGMKIARKDITMTFGNDGFWSKPSENGYTQGQNTPVVSNNIPQRGTFYKFRATTTGSLKVKVKLGHDGNGKLRPLHVSENGILVKAKKGDGTELDPANMPEATANYEGIITFPVKANTDYYVYVTGSKLGFYNFTFEPATLVTTLYSYNVKGTTKPECNESRFIEDGSGNKLVKFTFGGWKYSNNKYLKPNADDIDANYITDGWSDPAKQAKVNALDGYEYAISGKNDAVQEDKTATKEMYGKTRYGWFESPTRDKNGVTTDSHPYTLPVRGAYMTFEPTQNGTLTIYLLQNGAWNSDTKNNIDIIPGEFRMHAFQITNQRGLVLAEFAPKYSITTNQKVADGYSCTKYLIGEKPAKYDKTSKDVSNWEEFWALDDDERQAVYDNWKNGNNGSQTIIKLKDGSFLAIQKAIVKYEFHVTGNETYYVFSNFSKLGFSGATFQPDAQPTAKPAEGQISTLELSDVIAYNEITATPKNSNIEGTELKDYTYTIGGKEIAPVAGVYIPQFYSIKLTRTFKKDQWTTLSLPFNLTQTEVEQIFGKGTQIIVFDKANPTSARIYLTFFYHEIQNVLPGYPYLIRPTLVDADGKQMVTKSNSADYAPTYTISDDGKELTAFTVYNKAINPAIEQHEFVSGDYTAKCTPSYCTANVSGNGRNDYSKQYENGDIFVSESKGTVYISEGKSYGKGYRSYIDYTGTTAPAKALSISFSGVEDGDDNGTTTDIRIAELADDVIQTLGIGGVYNLNGQKVADTTRNLPAGIYIVNGRKVVVK